MLTQCRINLVVDRLLDYCLSFRLRSYLDFVAVQHVLRLSMLSVVFTTGVLHLCHLTMNLSRVLDSDVDYRYYRVARKQRSSQR